MIDRIASTPGLLDALGDAHARARARVWELAGAPERLTIDLDATLITAHSEKDQAAGTFKGGYGFAPMLAYADETGEALAGQLRPGNAGANNATDQIAVAEQAIAQIPAGHIETIEILLRVDSAGASHELIDWCREGQIEFSVGYDLTETVRAAILQIPEDDWVCSLDQDGHARPNGQVCEITEHLDLSSWPQRTRVIVRRERAHPGAQLSFTDHDGHRFQAILTDQTGPIAELERDHRGRARVEDHIRNDKDTGLRNLPFRDFEHNQVWLQIVRLAHDLIVWTQRLLLTGELTRANPSACATAYCTSPPVSRSTPAPRHCACRPRGPGRKTSPPRSHSSRRFPHPPDTARSDTRENIPTPRRTRPAKPAPDHPSQPPPTPTTPRDGLNWPHHPRHHPPVPTHNPKHSPHADSCTIRASSRPRYNPSEREMISRWISLVPP